MADNWADSRDRNHASLIGASLVAEKKSLAEAVL